MEYVDQYLIHWPKNKKLNQDTWKALLKLFDEGKCKPIGVSNFSIEDLEDLKEMGDLIPVTNQIRLSPWDYNSEIMDYCKSEGILLVAYSPLNEEGGLNNKILFDLNN